MKRKHEIVEWDIRTDENEKFELMKKKSWDRKDIC